jgi:hypothetical protein
LLQSPIRAEEDFKNLCMCDSKVHIFHSRTLQTIWQAPFAVTPRRRM